MNSAFPQTDREACMEALRTVLQSIPGVGKVYRHGETPKEVSAANLPAIIIVEGKVKYRKHNDRRRFLASFPVFLSFLTMSQRTRAAPGGNLSTVREAFASVIITTLLENPELICQLEGEAEPVKHAYHVGAGDEFEVEFDDDAEFPYCGGVVEALVQLHVNFDDRATELWTTMTMETTPHSLAEGEESDATKVTDTDC